MNSKNRLTEIANNEVACKPKKRRSKVIVEDVSQIMEGSFGGDTAGNTKTCKDEHGSEKSACQGRFDTDCKSRRYGWFHNVISCHRICRNEDDEFVCAHAFDSTSSIYSD